MSMSSTSEWTAPCRSRCSRLNLSSSKPRSSEKSGEPFMILYTIGFTQKSARRFFELLDDAGVKTLLDIRLNPYGQLSGFSKKDDLAYFLERLSGIDYHHLAELAPTDDILQSYRKAKNWDTYVD